MCFKLSYVMQNNEGAGIPHTILDSFWHLMIASVFMLLTFVLSSLHVFRSWNIEFEHMMLIFLVSSIQVLAVKKLDCTVIPFQSSDDFIELVSNISKLHHPNLNDLVGYCMEHGQHLLVFDFHGNGSLHDLRHLSA